MAKNLKLKAARAALDMTQADLAAVVGVSRQTINAIEKGEYNPTSTCLAIRCGGVVSSREFSVLYQINQFFFIIHRCIRLDNHANHEQ
jgi:putative transcriptional regulator